MIFTASSRIIFYMRRKCQLDFMFKNIRERLKTHTRSDFGLSKKLVVKISVKKKIVRIYLAVLIIFANDATICNNTFGECYGVQLG